MLKERVLRRGRQHRQNAISTSSCIATNKLGFTKDWVDLKGLFSVCAVRTSSRERIMLD